MDLLLIIGGVALLYGLCVAMIGLGVRDHRRRLWRGGDGKFHRRG